MSGPHSQEENSKIPNDCIQEGVGGIYLLVSVRPGSKMSGFRGYHGNTLRIAIKEPAEGGRANLGLELFLAKSLDLSPNQVRISSGHTAKIKRVFLQGSPEILRARVERMRPSNS